MNVGRRGSTLARAKAKGFFGLLADVQVHRAECPSCGSIKSLDDFEGILTDGVHLASNDVEVLHAFALRMGLKRSWFQDPVRDRKVSHPHYDLITVGAFHRAMSAGAKYVDYRTFSRWRRGSITSM